MDLQLKDTLRNLCCNNGWSYAVLWRVKCPDSMLLISEDAYYEEQFGMVIDKMLHQVHVMGEGIIGQVAFTGKHRWIFSDICYGELSPIGPFDNQAAFQDTAESCHQFSAGIKTIAIIPVSSQGVIQFGSNQKIVERLEFVGHIRSLFRHLESRPEPFLYGTEQRVFNSEIYDPRGTFASVISSINTCSNHVNVKPLPDKSYKELPLSSGLNHGCLQPQTFAVPLFSSSTHADKYSSGLLQEGNRDVSALTPGEQQLMSGIGTEGLPNMFPPSSRTIGPCGNKFPNFQGDSILTPLYLTSQSLDITYAITNTRYGAGKMVDNQNPSLFNVSDGEPSTCKSYSRGACFVPQLPKESPSFQMLPGEFRPVNTTLALPNPNPENNLTQRTAPQLEQVNNGMDMPPNGDLLQALGFAPLPSSFVGCDVTSSALVNDVARPFHNPISCSIKSLGAICDGKENSLNAPEQLPTVDGFFDSLGLDLRQSQGKESWDDIILPVGSGNHSNLSNSVSECISELDMGSLTGNENGFLSGLELEQLLDAFVSNVSSVTNLNSDDQSSTTTIRRPGSTSEYSNQVQLTGLSCLSGTTDALLPPCNSEKTRLRSEKNMLSKSLVSSWFDDSYSINAESAITVQPKRTDEQTKVTRKRARPGESTRPRPKDRQQIQDRVKELREIVPNGVKCSIDSLLDRTIKHMLFLQGVTKYADKLKQVDEPKMVGKESAGVIKDNSNGNIGGATWAYEVGGQNVVCPIIVEDLNPPGQMLVEMLCQEQGFFLELADIIRGFGLTILKGVLEVRDDKIWARFVVEANRDVTRMDIFLSLVQFLHQKQ
ncbi:transcription factor LHW-like [Tasmannia lanceolata]|uniref:transcription factor LHW-like n=1 Tax=Tasmannia lanceolata TaxID=3420 RepID=UPI0040641474